MKLVLPHKHIVDPILILLAAEPRTRKKRCLCGPYFIIRCSNVEFATIEM
jgi:hypothetical protein